MSVKIVAHRGESKDAPENTLESFKLAWERGAMAIEGDFHLTKDGQVVCMHDTNTKRTCGVDGELRDKTLAEIQALDAGGWKGAQWRNVKAPTLLEVLKIMPDHGEIYIELKSVGPIIEAIKNVFAQGSWRVEQLTFIAFDEETIKAVKQLFPEHHCYWLLSNGVDVVKYLPDELAAKLNELGVDGVDIHCNDKITQDYVTAVHDAGKSFHVWTVNDIQVAKRMRDIGVDSITTDCASVITAGI